MTRNANVSSKRSQLDWLHSPAPSLLCVANARGDRSLGDNRATRALLKRRAACKPTLVAELSFDSQELVKLCHSLAAATGTRLQESGAYGHSQVRDSGVLRLS